VEGGAGGPAGGEAAAEPDAAAQEELREDGGHAPLARDTVTKRTVPRLHDNRQVLPAGCFWKENFRFFGR